jgi:hypothetical protein
MNKQTERMSMSEILNARYILQRRSDDHLIARDAVYICTNLPLSLYHALWHVGSANDCELVKFDPGCELVEFDDENDAIPGERKS